MRMNNRNRFCSAGLALAALLLCACPQVETPPASEPGFDIHIYESSTGRGMPIPGELIVQHEEAMIYFEVVTTAEEGSWSVTPSAEWCRFYKAMDLWSLSVDEYTGENQAPRTCTVRVDAGDLYKGSFTVIQQGKVFFDLPEMPGAFSVSPAGETRDRYVSTNAYKWTAETDASWLTVQQKSPTALTLTAAPRPEGERQARKATVTLKDICFTGYNIHPTTYTFSVTDADPAIDAGGYDYGDHIDWN